MYLGLENIWWSSMEIILARRRQRLASYSGKSAGRTMSMLRNCCRTSKSLSPVMMQPQPPVNAVASTLSSSRSRHTGDGSSPGSTTSAFCKNSVTASPASSGVYLNFWVSFSRNSLRMKSDVTSRWFRAQCSNKSLHFPVDINAAISTFVSRTILTKCGQTHPGPCRHPALSLWRSYAHATA